jgi:cell division protein FtsA
MPVFALDIGTRKVAGILGELRGDRVHIIDAVLMEHEQRAMIDGQIHSIEGVTSIVKRVKRELELRNGVLIEKVTTALAGRSLHTEKAEAVMEKNGEVTKADLAFLELESVRQAHSKLTESKKADYYCVGYSVVYFTIDAEPIKTPLQQLAKHSLGVSTIVTFLPRPVFDSMVSVLNNCGLVMDSITLEPIAALAVTIPEDMRLLNLALVDVGAGTSDIAITEKGRITAYGMIPKAGDEITEAVCHEFLVDFNNGELIKRTTAKDSPCMAKDIFNNDVFVDYDKLMASIYNKTEEVAKDVADGILALNNKQPQAVVMVGGGSALDLLRERVAANLSLPANRVGSRTPETIANIDNLPDVLKGTEGITPLGILETSLFKRGIGFVDVTVNGEKEYIINLDQKIRVIDALTSRGMEMRKLYGRPGSSITFTLNGEMKILRGSHGEHARIYINDIEKRLEDEVQKGDSIYISAAKDGGDASALISNIITEEYVIVVEINGKKHEIAPVIMCNEKEVTPEEPLADRAEIRLTRIDSARDVLSRAGFEAGNADERDIIITMNSEPVVLKQRNYQLKVNGQEVSADYRLKNMDRVEFRATPSFFRIKDLLKNAKKKKVTVKINGKPFEIEQERSEILMNGKKVSEDEFLINGAAIELKSVEEKMILSSIFKFYPIDTQRARGRMLELKVNGEKAGYTTPINEGADIEINFTEAV